MNDQLLNIALSVGADEVVEGDDGAIYVFRNFSAGFDPEEMGHPLEEFITEFKIKVPAATVFTYGKKASTKTEGGHYNIGFRL